MFKVSSFSKLFFVIGLLFLGSWFAFLSYQDSVKPTMPAEVEYLFRNYLKEASARGVDLSSKYVGIEFSEVGQEIYSDNQTAKCVYFPKPKVFINRTFWNQNSIAVRELIIFHELTHCLWFKPHYRKGYHLMNPISDQATLALYTNYRSKFLDDLFDSSKYSLMNIAQDYWVSITDLKNNQMFWAIMCIILIFLSREAFIYKIKKSKIAL